jgi:protein SCO1
MKTTWTRVLSGTSHRPASRSEILFRAIDCGLAALAVSCALAAGAAEDPALRSGVFKPARAAPEISLRGSDGAELKLARYRGKVVALGFGYTFCPDVCPTTLFNLAQAREKLGAAGKDLQVVYVTVDPERDTAERLKAYLAGFDPTFIGGTGAPEKLAEVRKAYGIVIAKETVKGSQTAYLVHHASFVYLIDRAGNLRALLPFGVTIDDIAHDVKALLESKDP